MPSSPSTFLNLDLELEGPADLAPLANAFSGRAFVLHCGAQDDRHHLCAEPVIEGALSNDPAACTEHMLRLIEGLRPEARLLWQTCTSRIFDYGFDGGLEDGPLSADVAAQHLQRMSALGISLRMTVYPYRAQEVTETGE